MKRLVLACLAAFAVSIPASAFAQDEGLGAVVNVFLGQKMMNSDDWEPVENQLELGVEGTVGTSWPVSAAVDVFYSMGSGSTAGVDVDGTTTEVALGARKVFSFDKIHPYVGGGLAYVMASAKAAGQSESGSGIGLWAGGGAYYSFGPAQAGLALRYSTATIKNDALDDPDGGGIHVGLIGGLTF